MMIKGIVYSVASPL